MPAIHSTPSPRRILITREGWLWLLITAVFFGIGLLKNINLLLLLSCFMLVLWLWNVRLAGRRLKRLYFQRRWPDLVFAQTPFSFELEISNPRQGATQGGLFQQLGARQPLGWFVPRLEKKESARLRQEAQVPRRGLFTWPAIVAVSGFPFGLTRRRLLLGLPEEMIVLPRLGHVHRGRLRRFLTRTGLASARNLLHARKHPTAQNEFHGLRTFRSGDSPRWIHWRTSARCGELMVREFEDVPTDNLIVVVDTFLPDEDSDESFEALLSLAATLCWEWCRQAGDQLVLIVAGKQPIVIDGVTGRDHTRRWLECLAVQNGTDQEPDGEPLDRLDGVALPAAPVLLLSIARSRLADALIQRLKRPVACLEVDHLDQIDFYERPANHDA